MLRWRRKRQSRWLLRNNRLESPGRTTRGRRKIVDHPAPTTILRPKRNDMRARTCTRARTAPATKVKPPDSKANVTSNGGGETHIDRVVTAAGATITRAGIAINPPRERGGITTTQMIVVSRRNAKRTTINKIVVTNRARKRKPSHGQTPALHAVRTNYSFDCKEKIPECKVCGGGHVTSAHEMVVYLRKRNENFRTNHKDDKDNSQKNSDQDKQSEQRGRSYDRR